MWPHGSLGVLILVITIAESFIRRNTKPSSLPRTATSETTRFKSTWVIYLSFGDISYLTEMSTVIPITTVCAVLLCSEEKMMWPVSIWNYRVSLYSHACILQQVTGQFQVVVSEDQRNKFRTIRSAKLWSFSRLCDLYRRPCSEHEWKTKNSCHCVRNASTTRPVPVKTD